MDRPIAAVVLAGGTGTRLYPATRSDRPKQFLSFGDEQSMLEATVERAGFADEVYVLTRPAFRDDVETLVPDVAVLTEPEPKDTGPALAYATHRVREEVGPCVVLALPSDHHIEGDFASTARRACRVAADTGRLVTIGVEPDRPATGYGYVEPGDGRGAYFEVESFTEKPGRERAERYLDDGYYWNSGTFAWTPEAFLDAAADTELGPLVAALDDGEPEQGYETVPSISVDYAVMESAADIAVVPADYEWDDLGTWDALARVFETDADRNAALGDYLALEAADNVIASDGHVSAVGVEDLVIASFDDRTLVADRDAVQRVRDVVEQLKTREAF
ncbi:Mannose-1-phosphate guanylyltransferase fused tocupin domain [Halapricum desulfuricans]|uniref:Mannose-1-phosphate guanylyltransferase fused tocupin domain n=1 Tax=Halapricum desulfuricans TaxID=2841257 RepID=A0A897NMH1_9EURY|nr:sugar phosphate nucleotidyltransferase [Halapricum desulfuricans]QSG12093.1 Mannose-1-phosphate guanylyltransferase fused tocupin domain [Halapricum desulfuricans]